MSSLRHHYIIFIDSINCLPHLPFFVTVSDGMVSNTMIGSIFSLQSTLQLLESLPELSPHARLLRCQASILLADVSCVQGGATWGDMVQVFKGLATMLETQVRLSSVLCTNSTRLAWEREGRKEWSHRHGSLAWEREGREEWSHRHGRAIE